MKSLLFSVLATRRSGHHAVIHWLCANAPGAAEHYNDCGDARAPRIHEGELVSQQRGEYTRKPCCVYDDARVKEFKLIVVNFEDPEVLDRRWIEFPWPGIPSGDRRLVLVIRNPYNVLASSWKADARGVIRKTIKTRMQTWLVHAREALGDTNALGDKTVVAFDTWVRDKAYRDRVAADLGIGTGDKGLNDVPSHGDGSTFDGKRFSGKAQKMRVTQRWEAILDDDNAWKLVTREHYDAAKRLFHEKTLPPVRRVKT